jgi:zinc finger protein
MTFEVYERSFDQNEELGLNDMIVEGYEGEKEAQEASAEADRVAAAAAAAEEKA